MPGISEESVDITEHEPVVVSISQIMYSVARQISLKRSQITYNNCIEIVSAASHRDLRY